MNSSGAEIRDQVSFEVDRDAIGEISRTVPLYVFFASGGTSIAISSDEIFGFVLLDLLRVGIADDNDYAIIHFFIPLDYLTELLLRTESSSVLAEKRFEHILCEP